MTANNKLKKYYVVYENPPDRLYVLFDELFDNLDDAIEYATRQIKKHNIPPDELENVRIYIADMTILLTGTSANLKPVEEKEENNDE